LIRRLKKESLLRFRWWAIAAAVLSLLSCGPESPQQGGGTRAPQSSQTSGTTATGAKKSWDQALPVASCGEITAPSPKAVLASAPPEEVHLYIDGSVSMKPFAGQGGRFGAVLEALRPALLDLRIDRSRVFRVGSGLEALSHAGGFERFDDAGFYVRNETNLAAALDAELKSTSTSALAIVVTDGVMSLQKDQGKAGELGACEQGSDVDCLSLKIPRLIESGRGFWLVGVRSTFRGILFSEKARVGGASLGRVAVPDRPFYLWVFSNHPPTGRAFVEKILHRVSVKPDGTEAFALEFAPGDLPWRLPESAQAPDSDGGFLPADIRSGAVRGKFVQAASSEAPVQVVAQQGLTGSGFALRIPLHETDLEKIPEGLTPVWRYRSAYCLRWEGVAPPGILQVRSAESGGSLHFGMLVPSLDGFAQRHAILVQRLERQPAEQNLVSSLDLWSTRDDRTIQAASRTYNLGDFLGALLAHPAPPNQYEQPILKLQFQ
jgi:hypothetical protein